MVCVIDGYYKRMFFKSVGAWFKSMAATTRTSALNTYVDTSPSIIGKKSPLGPA